jgi:hypothetical protein
MKKSALLSLASFGVAMFLNTAWATADQSQDQANLAANSAIEKILTHATYSGTDLNQKPCQVIVEQRNWGTHVYIAPSDVSFFISIDSEGSSAKILTQANPLKIVSEYPGNDDDESPVHFTITNTLTIREKNGMPSSVQVQTYDSGMDVSQNAVCNFHARRGRAPART